MTPAAEGKRPLGRTGLEVTPICFGTSGLGDMPDTYGYSVEEERAKRTIEAIFAGTVNFLDTSRIYGFGRSEARIGAVIRERGLPSGIVISTKLDRDPTSHVFDAGQARRSIEESLEALGLSKVDLLHLHDPRAANEAPMMKKWNCYFGSRSATAIIHHLCERILKSIQKVTLRRSPKLDF